MKIILSNIIKIEKPTKEMLQFCKKELTYKNPEIEKRKRMGFYVYGMDKEIKLYNYYEDNLYVPIGMFEKIYNQHPINEDYMDYTTIKNTNIVSNMVLRDYQKPVLQAITEKMNGIVIAPCGTGKTSMGLECIAHLKQKGLWICHTMELLNQAKERAEQTMIVKTSTITDGKCDTSGDIVFATVQTLLKFIEKRELKQNEFGIIVVDEVQHLSCNPNSIQMFRQSVEYFSARYKIGLSATVHRADGLHECIYKILGDPIYKIEQRDNDYACIYNNKILMKFPVDKFQVPAQIKIVYSNYDVMKHDVFSPDGGTLVYAKLISSLAENKERNDLILNILKKVQGSTVIISDRVEQLKYLCDKVENGVQIDGKTNKKVRKKAIDDVRSGKIKYLFASYNLIKEGLDCPILSNIVLATPVKDYAIVVQSIGRIQRPYQGKTIATVYDIIDDIGMLYRFYTKRRSTYRKNNWTISDMYLTGKGDW